MFVMPPTLVGDRLRLALAYLNVLNRTARLVDKPVPDGFLQFVNVEHFALWVATVADLTTTQVASALAVLPLECTTGDAPLIGGDR